MTAHPGTFVPFQAQNNDWGSNGFNQSSNWGFTGWNPNSTWNPNSAWNAFAAWNPGSAWNQQPYHNPQQNTSVIFVPTYGTNNSEIAQGVTPNASSVAFIPHHGQVSGAAFVPATALHPTTGWRAGNPQLGGIAHGNAPVSQSFATELFENHHEYVLSFDVPGIDIEDLDISLAGNTIYINGIRKDSREAATLAYSEIAKGNITRAITVPFDVSTNKAINTSLENGVLKIRIAKENHGDKRPTARKVKIG